MSYETYNEKSDDDVNCTEKTNKTLQYYNDKAIEFVNNTVDVNFTETQDLFLEFIPKKGRILDFGCGSGRDTKYFNKKGYLVDAIDGSEELCKIASEYSGIKVKCQLFQDLNEKDKYDGIWACASILHCSKQELQDILKKLVRALKKNGIIYTSFKYGDFEGMRNERLFSDFTEISFRKYVANFEEIEIEKQWITEDVRPGREDEKWLNIILRKSDSN